MRNVTSLVGSSTFGVSVAGFLVMSCIGCSGNSTAQATLSDRHGSKVAEADDAPALAVQAVSPVRKDLVVKFEQPGPIEAAEQADLYAKVTGYVKMVAVDIGDVVQAGQVLLELDVPDLEQELAYKSALIQQADAEQEQAKTAVQGAQAALVAWQGQLDQADADLKKCQAECHFREQQVKRYSDLAAKDATTGELADEKREQLGAALAAYDSAVAKRKGVMADRAVLEAKLDAAKADLNTKATRVDVAKSDRERTRIDLEFAKLKAPFDGVITRRTVDEGAFVNSAGSGRGDPIFTLARMDKVTVVMHVPEREVSAVKVGCRAQMRLSALGDKVVEGKVARFARSLDNQKTMRVEIDIPNESWLLYSGMYGPVTLILQEIKHALTLPASAVYAVEGKSQVIQVVDGKAHRVAVKTGYDDGVVIQILQGLLGDEEIVVSNKGQITEGQSLKPFHTDQPVDASDKPEP
jgi:HlyD family secretion protein